MTTTIISANDSVGLSLTVPTNVTVDSNITLSGAVHSVIGGAATFTTALVANSSANIFNYGEIEAVSGSFATGVELLGGGTITNEVGATITGLNSGYAIFSNLTTTPIDVVNSGVLTASNNAIAIEDVGDVGINNTSTGTISSSTARAVFLQGSSNASVANYGSITGSVAGIYINGSTSESVINGTGAHLLGGNYGVLFIADGTTTQTLFNSGSIGSAAEGVNMGDVTTADLTNTSTGTISGASSAINVYPGASGSSVTITNAGLVTGATGIVIGSNAYSTSATVTNTGTITGTGGTAISDVNGPLDLIVAAGAVFNGAVIASTTFQSYVSGGYVTSANTLNVLDLTSTSTVSTLSGIGTQFENFNTILIDSGAAWTLSGDATGLASGEVIDGFTNLDKLDLTGFAATSESFASNALTLSDGSSTVTLNITAPGLSSANFHISTDGTNTYITDIPCFARGTRILTTSGQVCVEDLAVGDLLPTQLGGIQPIIWLGTRKVDITHHNNPPAVWPVLICAGAFGEGQPQRDLYVSPGHSVYVDGMLIQAEKLINGATIRQLPWSQVEYWHIELPSHDILLAENLPTESYLDTGNRTAFANGGAFLDLHPDFRSKHWAETCVPLVQEGPALARAKAALLARTALFGYEMVADSDVHILADGHRIEAVSLGNQRRAFMIPADCADIELRSHNFVPAHGNPASDDRRALGLCIARLQIDGTEVALDDLPQEAGWNWPEHGADGTGWRWTTGATKLPGQCRLVVLDTIGAGQYWHQPEADRVLKVA